MVLDMTDKSRESDILKLHITMDKLKKYKYSKLVEKRTVAGSSQEIEKWIVDVGLCQLLFMFLWRYCCTCCAGDRITKQQRILFYLQINSSFLAKKKCSQTIDIVDIKNLRASVLWISMRTNSINCIR
ncbi:hypothetical protein BDC45DRAFT_535862 [Circinella umbellata]|nr:hypothetical protein BDC45DRAFT_535862 [Circinella umbellata]